MGEAVGVLVGIMRVTDGVTVGNSARVISRVGLWVLPGVTVYVAGNVFDFGGTASFVGSLNGSVAAATARVGNCSCWPHAVNRLAATITKKTRVSFPRTHIGRMAQIIPLLRSPANLLQANPPVLQSQPQHGNFLFSY